MAFAAAHRGLSGQYAENTIAALRAAANAGFPCLELDLRVTSDGEVVVLHDAGIERTTDGNGRVADMRYDEVRTYDTGEGPIPRLDDVFAALKEWDGLWNLEIKAWHATKPAMDLVRHHGLEERVILSAMDPRALRLALERHPDCPRGLIILGTPDVEDMDLAADMGCSWLMPDQDFLTDKVLEEMLFEGYHVGAWTVNEPDDAISLAQRGVDMIITDVAEVLEAVPGRPRLAG